MLSLQEEQTTSANGFDLCRGEPQYISDKLIAIKNYENLKKCKFWEKSKGKPQLEAQVDLNRNFPLGFGLGADDKPCSEVYKGQVGLIMKVLSSTKMKLLMSWWQSGMIKIINSHCFQAPLSEPETQALQLIAGLLITVVTVIITIIS